MVVLFCLPGRAPEPAGVLLLETESNQLAIKLKPKLNQDDEMVAAFWDELAEDLSRQAQEAGGSEVVRWLEMTASHVFQISPRISIESSDLDQTMQRLYREHVELSQI